MKLDEFIEHLKGINHVEVDEKECNCGNCQNRRRIIFVIERQKETLEWIVSMANVWNEKEVEISELKAENERLTSKVKHLQISYGDLIMTVGDKYPDESRHEIARRYILEAETQNSVSCKAVEALEDQK